MTFSGDAWQEVIAYGTYWEDGKLKGTPDPREDGKLVSFTTNDPIPNIDGYINDGTGVETFVDEQFTGAGFGGSLSLAEQRAAAAARLKAGYSIGSTKGMGNNIPIPDEALAKILQKVNIQGLENMLEDTEKAIEGLKANAKKIAATWDIDDESITSETNLRLLGVFNKMKAGKTFAAADTNKDGALSAGEFHNQQLTAQKKYESVIPSVRSNIARLKEIRLKDNFLIDPRKYGGEYDPHHFDPDDPEGNLWPWPQEWHDPDDSIEVYPEGTMGVDPVTGEEVPIGGTRWFPEDTPYHFPPPRPTRSDA
jgi:hypothetical protein